MLLNTLANLWTLKWSESVGMITSSQAKRSMISMKTRIVKIISNLTYPKTGTVFIDQFGDYWYSDDNTEVEYGQYGLYYGMKHTTWGFWKIDRHLWVKKNGSPFKGIILKRVDMDKSISV